MAITEKYRYKPDPIPHDLLIADRLIVSLIEDKHKAAVKTLGLEMTAIFYLRCSLPQTFPEWRKNAIYKIAQEEFPYFRN